jgi:hypothetical protein
VTLVLAILAVLICIVDITNVNNVANRSTDQFGSDLGISVGWGLYVALVASAALGIASVVSRIRAPLRRAPLP